MVDYQIDIIPLYESATTTECLCRCLTLMRVDYDDLMINIPIKHIKNTTGTFILSLPMIEDL